VVIVPEEELRRESCWVHLVLSDRETEHHVVDAVGSVDNPMTPAGLLEKAHLCCDPVLGTAGAEVLLDAVRSLPDVPSVARLTDASHG